MDVRSNGLTDADTAKLFIPIVDRPHFESFSGIPIKQIRDNAITTLDLKGARGALLEPCGGVVLAHSLKTNTSVTSVSETCLCSVFCLHGESEGIKRSILRRAGATSLTRLFWCAAARCFVLLHTTFLDVKKVDVSNNGLQPEGGKALADCLKINTTITQVR